MDRVSNKTITGTSLTRRTIGKDRRRSRRDPKRDS